MTTAIITLLESCVEEAREIARRGYPGRVSYLRTLEEDAPGLISRARENWLSLRSELQLLGMNGERRATEYVLLTASKLLPVFNAALADQYVNVASSDEPSFVSPPLSQDVLFEIESLERDAAKPLKPLAQCEILLRGAQLCQAIIDDCLNRLIGSTKMS